MGPQGALGATKLLRPFSEVVDSLGIKDPFIRNWIALLSFLLAGVKSDGVLLAKMIYMFTEWYKPGCSLEYPVGGSGAIVDALVRGLQKFGGPISLRSHVEKIVVENGRAVRVQLRSGQFVRAKKAVVSNASMLKGKIMSEVAPIETIAEFDERVLEIGTTASIEVMKITYMYLLMTRFQDGRHQHTMTQFQDSHGGLSVLSHMGSKENAYT